MHPSAMRKLMASLSVDVGASKTRANAEGWSKSWSPGPNLLLFL
jgi:hypothetical protein